MHKFGMCMLRYAQVMMIVYKLVKNIAKIIKMAETTKDRMGILEVHRKVFCISVQQQ